MNSTVSRGIIVVVLITCTMLVLWWVTPRPEDQGGWLVTDVLTGDTIRVTRGEDLLLVHLIGIEAPEPGACGFDGSRDYLESGIKGVEVVLIADAAVPEHDNAAQRYVELSGRDAGLEQVRTGNAVPDGTRHSREGPYDAAAEDAVTTCG